MSDDDEWPVILEKVTAATGATLDDAQWRALLHGYEQAR